MFISSGFKYFWIGLAYTLFIVLMPASTNLFIHLLKNSTHISLYTKTSIYYMLYLFISGVILYSLFGFLQARNSTKTLKRVTIIINEANTKNVAITLGYKNAYFIGNTKNYVFYSLNAHSHAIPIDKIKEIIY